MTLNLEQTLTLPYRGWKRTLVLCAIYLVGTIFFLGGALMRLIAPSIRINSTGVIITLQLVLALIGLLFYLVASGYFARLIQQVGRKKVYLMPRFDGIIELLVIGFKIELIGLTYFIPYIALQFVPGTLGIVLTIIYGITLVIFLPAIIVHTAITASFRGGFAWTSIWQYFTTARYWMAYFISILIGVVYALTIWLIGVILILIMPSGAGGLLRNSIPFIILLTAYIFLGQAGFSSICAQLGTAWGKEKKGRNRSLPARPKKKKATKNISWFSSTRTPVTKKKARKKRR